MYADMQSRTAERLISVPFSARGLGDQQAPRFLIRQDAVLFAF